MTSDGAARLRHILSLHTNELLAPTITVRKMVVAESISGTFIQRISDYTDSLFYATYRETMFRIPAGSTILEMYMGNANHLRSFTAGPGTALESLVIVRSMLDRLPETIGMLRRLRELSITESELATVDFASFANNTQLRVVNLRNNCIERIVPQLVGSTLVLGIESISLATNRILLLDMVNFVPMPLLREILMQENRIQRISASVPFTACKLITLSLPSNRITQIELTGLTFPALEYLILDDNALATIPSDWTNVPSLRVLSLERNHIQRLDMRSLHQLQSLDILYLGGNRIEQVWASAPVELSSLRMLHLAQNRIREVNMRACRLPQIRNMVLTNNPMSTIPSLFKTFPQLHISIDSLRVQCPLLLQFRRLMSEGRLSIDYIEDLMGCNLGVINMTSDGGAKLRAAIENINDNIIAINIDKLIVSSSASGPFLQRISAYTEAITYVVYRDPVFQIPDGNTIEEFYLIGAPVLRAIVAGSNSHLKKLQLGNCLLDRVPPTLSKLVELEELIITQCALTALRLDMLVANHKLTTVDLSQNQIRQILPVTATPKQKSAIETLGFEGNLLERLDMAMFAIMPNLEKLDVRGNRIVRFEATAPVTYASLIRLSIAMNKISYFDTRNLTLPLLVSIYMDQNDLTDVPTNWGAMPELRYLGFEENNLKRVNMNAFRTLHNLTSIYASNNKIESIRSSSPVAMPALEELIFDHNQIASVNFSGCVFRNMDYISMVDNQLTAIPPLFQLLPKVRMSVLSNPIKCSNMASFKNRIIEDRLYVNIGAKQSECDTTSSIVLDQSTRNRIAEKRLYVTVGAKQSECDTTSSIALDQSTRLRAAIENINDNIIAINIDKLIVSSSASGPFLQRISAYTETISYVVYRDPVFQIPDGNTIEEIALGGAGALRAIVAGTNSHLKKLQLGNCLLDRVPPTLSKLVELEELIITQCALIALRLDMLVANHKLTTVDLSQNQIRQILPVTAIPKQKSVIANLVFTNNLLERLDMAMFAIMPDLKRLEVEGNRIVRFEATAPVTYASLNRLRIARNKISYFDTRNLTLPSLTSIYMDHNELTDIPTNWGAIPQLKYLGFEANNLKRVDMSVFQTLQNLTSVYLGSNKIESIRTSSPVTLPALKDLSFYNNHITSVNLRGCNFPEFGYISLTDNHLTAIPPLFQLFRNGRMSVISNPIKCSNMTSFKNRIAERRLYVTVRAKQSECNTTSSIMLDQSTLVCCEA
uniref:Fibromodulin n=1 Tax=Anopheles dirus TaxID=7168 RepID=A0A182NHW4_9DIPT